MNARFVLSAVVGAALAATAIAGRAGAQAQNDETRAKELSERYDVDQDKLKDLRKEGMSWEDIHTAAAISERSGQELDQIVEMRKQGQDWGSISQSFGFDVNELDVPERTEGAPGEESLPGQTPGQQQEPMPGGPGR